MEMERWFGGATEYVNIPHVGNFLILGLVGRDLTPNKRMHIIGIFLYIYIYIYSISNTDRSPDFLHQPSSSIFALKHLGQSVLSLASNV